MKGLSWTNVLTILAISGSVQLVFAAPQLRTKRADETAVVVDDNNLSPITSQVSAKCLCMCVFFLAQILL